VKPAYVDTVRLLLAVAPTVFEPARFALKGGTALNFFVDDMPRLSVDIDVVFTDPTLEREAALNAIATDLRQVKASLTTLRYFDVGRMLGQFAWRPEMLDCFVAYLAGHNRPVHEVLFPHAKPLEPAFSSEFAGMVSEPIELAALQATQRRLLHELPRAITRSHREFLRSLVRAEPNWDLMPFATLRDLPALQWKLVNLRKLKSRSAERFEAQASALAEYFDRL
jgi:hypothetical protein